jgi:3',5'-cyclic AMP phosphodiesterase CpdA
MFSLAHLSDPHLPLPAWTPGKLPPLSAKRLSCLLSWKTKRHAIHRPEILAGLIADIEATVPDHIVVTGDLINISIPDEFAAAHEWLTALGTPDRVTVVPGNHDLLADDLTWQESLGRWGVYMSGEKQASGVRFPFVRRRGSVALVGLSTAVPTRLFQAGGSLGPDQIAAAKAWLAALGREGLCRIVLLHHPPMESRHLFHSRKMLRDHAEFRAAVAAVGAELVLHGHSHRFGLTRIELEQGGYVPTLSVPSGSAVASDERAAAGWNLYRIHGESGGGWRIEVTSRGLDAGGAFKTRGRFSLVLNSAS